MAAFAFSRFRICSSRFLQRTLWNFCHAFAGTKVSLQSLAAHFCCLGFGITGVTLNVIRLLVKGNRNQMTRQEIAGVTEIISTEVREILKPSYGQSLFEMACDGIACDFAADACSLR